MSKKIYLAVFVLFVIALMFVFFTGRSSSVVAPSIDDNMPAVGLEEKPLVGGMVAATQEPTIKDDVKEFTISGQNFSFTPNVMKVNKGDKVRIIFQNTAGFHDFKIDEYGIATKQAKAPYQEILEFTANKVGSFEYYCSVGTHRSMGMKGILTVE